MRHCEEFLKQLVDGYVDVDTNYRAKGVTLKNLEIKKNSKNKIETNKWKQNFLIQAINTQLTHND